MMRQYLSVLIRLLMNYAPCTTVFGHFHKGLKVEFTNTFNDMIGDEWFDQKLDHFDPTNEITWKQRYATNSKFFTYTLNSPVFLMISGESLMHNEYLEEGAWINYAKKYGALCIQLEHRYYGKSHPTPDMSTENLKYLSSKQALADLAHFINSMNKKYGLKESNKWISFGGSYAGDLSVWLRIKYPHLVHAAVSSSAPVLAQEDFTEYHEVVRSALRTYGGENCAQTVTDAFHQIQLLLENQFGRKKVERLFRLCSKIDKKEDVRMLFLELSGYVAEAVQYNKASPFHSSKIDKVCSILTNQAYGPPLHRYAALTNYISNLNCVRDKVCLPCTQIKYAYGVESLRNIYWNSKESARQWIYQTCTEFGFFQTSETKYSLYGPTISLEFYLNLCTDVFGPSFTEQQLISGINQTNARYGGLNIQVSRVVFVQGSLDPWHRLGINEAINNEAPAIVIDGASHCQDMQIPSPYDSPALKEAHFIISGLIGKWLTES